MVVTFLGTSEVDFVDRESGNHIIGTNMWYHFDRPYSPGWVGLQTVKKFIKPEDPILSKIRSLTPGKKINIEFVSIGKSSILADVKEING